MIENFVRKDTKYKKVIHITQVYFFISIILAMMCTILLLVNNKPPCYSYIPLLPFTFIICAYLMKNKYKYLFKNISITLLIALYYFRLVVLPFVLFCGNYSMTIIRTMVINNYMTNGILIMCYEAIVVFSVLSISKITNNNLISIKAKNIVKNKSISFKIIIILILGFMTVGIILYPQLRYHISFFLTTSNETSIIRANNKIIMKMTVPAIIYRVYIYLFDIMQIIIPTLLIEKIYSKSGKKNAKVGLFLTFILISIVFLFMTSEKAISVILAMILLFITHLIYKKKTKKLMPITIITLAILTFLGLILKSGVNHNQYNFWQSVSSMLNSYFSGVPNVAVAMSIKTTESLKLMVSDILTSIPFLNHFFKDTNNSVKIFNYILYNGGKNTDQIIPMIGQGYIFFGCIFSPIFSVICAKTSIILENCAAENSGIFNKCIYMFCSVLLGISPVLYNFNILILLFSKIIILLIFIKLANFKLLISSNYKKEYR